MIPVDEARTRILNTLSPLGAEQISLANALGRVLAEDVAARRTQPPMAVSAMDGYAVRAADVANLPATLKLIGESKAGGMYEGAVGAGQAVRIFTGAPIPDGADTIVMQENTEAGDASVRVLEGDAPAGRFVRAAGLDFTEGDTLLAAGKTLTARDIGLAASMNVPWLRVARKPRIAILATGDEIVMPGDPVAPNQIVSSNALTLAGFIRAWGGDPIDLGIALDDPASLKAMVAGAEGTDMLVTTGGASVGDHDLVQSVLGDVGLNVDFWKIAMRPGKPLIYGALNNTPLLGLPGNPVSSLVCAVIFLGPAILKLLGAVDKSPERITVRLGGDLGKNDEREDYLRAALKIDDDGNATATPFGKQDSSMFALAARADCLIVRAPFAPPSSIGDAVEIVSFGRGNISA